jgi:hypothetical protein
VLRFTAKGDDKIPAMLAEHEFVMRPEAVKREGVAMMHAINEGRATGTYGGGPRTEQVFAAREQSLAINARAEQPRAERAPLPFVPRPSSGSLSISVGDVTVHNAATSEDALARDIGSGIIIKMKRQGVKFTRV